MIPARSNQLIDNPREVLAQGGREAVRRRLARQGYIVQEQVLSDFVQVLRSGKPWFLEGAAGTGKTAISIAIQFGFNLPLFPFVGREELKESDLLCEWDREVQNQFVIQAVGTKAKTLEEAQAEQYALRFLKMGAALHAFHWASEHKLPPLLFGDELDKMPVALQDALLQLFESGYSYVPHLDRVLGIYDEATGKPDRRSFPIVVCAANALRHQISEPFRSRCLYTWIDPATPLEVARIMYAQAPGVSPYLLGAVLQIDAYLDTVTGLRRKPGLRELIDVLHAFIRDGVTFIDEPMLKGYVCYLAKEKKHRQSLLNALGGIEGELEEPDEQVQLVVEEVFDTTGRMLEAA